MSSTTPPQQQMVNQTIGRLLAHLMDVSERSCKKQSLEDNSTVHTAATDETEVSREEAFSSFLTDITLNDVHLEGSDGGRIPANRCVLSARSKVFRQMLLGKFSEANKKVVKIGYPTSVLTAVVEYILTDQPEILLIEQDTNSIPIHEMSRIRTLVSLTGAAIYFQLADLCRKALDCIRTLLAAAPGDAYAVMEACRQEGLGVPQDVETMALAVIRNYTGPIEPSHVEFLSPSLLAEILQDEQLRMEEYQLFQILRYWAQVDESDDSQSPLEQIEAFAGTPLPSVRRDTVRNSLISIGSRDSVLNVSGLRDSISSGLQKTIFAPSADDISRVKSDDVQQQSSPLENRRTIALELVNLIHLEYIDPHLLSTSVASSGLVTTNQLLEAYKQQALSAKMQYNINFQRPRYMVATWRSTCSTIFSSPDEQFKEDFLNYPPIKSGIHRWTVEVEESGQYTWLGLVLCDKEGQVDLSDEIQNRSWVYGNDGDSFHGGICRSVGPEYGAGSSITFTLNMMPYAEGNGTLDACLDGGDNFRVFSNLRADLAAQRWRGEGGGGSFLDNLSQRGGRYIQNHNDHHDQVMGFLPAVSMHSPGGVRVLHIRSLKT